MEACLVWLVGRSLEPTSLQQIPEAGQHKNNILLVVTFKEMKEEEKTWGKGRMVNLTVELNYFSSVIQWLLSLIDTGIKKKKRQMKKNVFITG